MLVKVPGSDKVYLNPDRIVRVDNADGKARVTMTETGENPLTVVYDCTVEVFIQAMNGGWAEPGR